MPFVLEGGIPLKLRDLHLRGQARESLPYLAQVVALRMAETKRLGQVAGQGGFDGWSLGEQAAAHLHPQHQQERRWRGAALVGGWLLCGHGVGKRQAAHDFRRAFPAMVTGRF
jgi:hypothetical protein